MKLQTLNYIHELLIATEKKARDAKRAAWAAWNQAEFKNDPDCTDLVEQKDYTREAWNQANDALNDFENQDWR